MSQLFAQHSREIAGACGWLIAAEIVACAILANLEALKMSTAITT